MGGVKESWANKGKFLPEVLPVLAQNSFVRKGLPGWKMLPAEALTGETHRKWF